MKLYDQLLLQGLAGRKQKDGCTVLLGADFIMPLYVLRETFHEASYSNLYLHLFIFGIR